MELRNEFAAVEVDADASANGQRLKITDIESGRKVFLDPYFLKVLTQLPPKRLEEIVNGGMPDEQ